MELDWMARDVPANRDTAAKSHRKDLKAVRRQVAKRAAAANANSRNDAPSEKAAIPMARSSQTTAAAQAVKD